MAPPVDPSKIDPFKSAQGRQKESERKLLEAVASAGTAGREAFKQAQTETTAAKQAALKAAADRASLVGLQGAVDPTKLDTMFGRHLSAQSGAQQRFTQGLEGMQASNQSYLEKVGAAAPLLALENEQQIAARQKEIEAALALEKQRREEEAAAQLAAEQRAEQRAIRSEGRADARARAKAAQKAAAEGPDVSLEALMGFAQQAGQMEAQPLKHMSTTEERNQAALREITRQQAGFGDRDAQFNLAAQIGQQLGVPDQKLAEMFGPTFQKKVPEAKASKDEVAKALTNKYATKGVRYETAKSALGGDDFKNFVNYLAAGKARGTGETLTQEQAQQDLYDFFIRGEGRKGGNPGPWVAEYEILLGEYVPRLPRAKDLEK